MRPVFLVLVLALGVLAAGSGAARASTVQNINPYHCPTGIGVGFGNPYTLNAAESGGGPVQLSFGWAALQPKQLDKFISFEFGSLTLTDPAGNVVFQDSWGGNMSGWSAYAPQQVTNGTVVKSGWATSRHELFGALSNPNPGTNAVYNLTMDWEIGRGSVPDGYGSFAPGPIVQVTDCPITIHNSNSGP